MPTHMEVQITIIEYIKNKSDKNNLIKTIEPRENDSEKNHHYPWKPTYSRDEDDVN